MTITTRRLGAITFATALALGLTGCGQLAEEAIEQAVENESGQDVEIDFDSDDGTMSIEGENGESFSFDVDDDGETSTFSGTDEDGNSFEMTSGGDLPDDWPSDVPVPPGNLVSATSMTDNTDRMLSISIEVDDAGRAHDDYVAQLQTTGFTVGGTSSFENEGTSQQFTDLARDDWTAQVVGIDDGSLTQLIISLQSADE